MLCPSCDGITNVLGCQSCGWKTGDPVPAHRVAQGTRHPLIAGAEYAHSVGTKPVFSLEEKPAVPFVPRVAPGFNSPAADPGPEAPAVPVEVAPEPTPEPEPQAPAADPEPAAIMGDSLTKTVQ